MIWQRRSGILVEPLAYRLMVCFCLSLQEMTTSLLDGIFVREECKRSPGWIRQIAEEYSLLVIQDKHYDVSVFFLVVYFSF